MWANRVYPGFEGSQVLDKDLDVMIGKINFNKRKAMGKMKSYKELGAENVLMVDEENGMEAALQYSSGASTGQKA